MRCLNDTPAGTTLRALKKLFEQTPPDLEKGYMLVLRLRSQLLGMMQAEGMLGGSGRSGGACALAEEEPGAASGPSLVKNLTDGRVRNGVVTLTIHEPLPSAKELTPAVREHWVDLMQAAIGKAARASERAEAGFPHFEEAFVWIEIITPKGTDNARLWDTSNRAVNLVINNLKGALFEDDNHEHMAFGVAGRWGRAGESAGLTRIRVMDMRKVVCSPQLRGFFDGFL